MKIIITWHNGDVEKAGLTKELYEYCKELFNYKNQTNWEDECLGIDGESVYRLKYARKIELEE